jgi:hypothetical protein
VFTMFLRSKPTTTKTLFTRVQGFLILFTVPPMPPAVPSVTSHINNLPLYIPRHFKVALGSLTLADTRMPT